MIEHFKWIVPILRVWAPAISIRLKTVLLHTLDCQNGLIPIFSLIGSLRNEQNVRLSVVELQKLGKVFFN